MGCTISCPLHSSFVASPLARHNFWRGRISKYEGIDEHGWVRRRYASVVIIPSYSTCLNRTRSKQEAEKTRLRHHTLFSTSFRPIGLLIISSPRTCQIDKQSQRRTAEVGKKSSHFFRRFQPMGLLSAWEASMTTLVGIWFRSLRRRGRDESPGGNPNVRFPSY